MSLRITLPLLMIVSSAHAWHVQITQTFAQPTHTKTVCSKTPTLSRVQYLGALRGAVNSGLQAAQKAVIAADLAYGIANHIEKTSDQDDVLQDLCHKAKFSADVAVAAANNADRGISYASSIPEGFPSEFLRAVLNLVMSTTRESRWVAQGVNETINYALQKKSASALLASMGAGIRAKSAQDNALEAEKKLNAFMMNYDKFAQQLEQKTTSATKANQGLVASSAILLIQVAYKATQAATALQALADACNDREADLDDAINKAFFAINILDVSAHNAQAVVEMLDNEQQAQHAAILSSAASIQEKAALISKAGAYATALAAAGSARKVKQLAEQSKKLAQEMVALASPMEPLTARASQEDQRAYTTLFHSAARMANQAAKKADELRKALENFVNVVQLNNIAQLQDAYGQAVLARHVAQSAIQEVDKSIILIKNQITTSETTMLLIRACDQAKKFAQHAIDDSDMVLSSLAANSFGDAHKACQRITEYCKATQTAADLAYTIAEAVLGKSYAQPETTVDPANA